MNPTLTLIQRYTSALLFGFICFALFFKSAVAYPKVLFPFPPEAIIVPNTFTPNNDGVNDEFKINLNGNPVVTYNLNVYAKWGILMFSTENPNVSWDGRTTSGLKAAEGTYFYVLTVNGKDYTGTLTLLE